MSDRKIRRSIPCLSGFLFQPAALSQRFCNNPLKLSVCTAKLIGCPFFNGIHCLGIYTQNKTLY